MAHQWAGGPASAGDAGWCAPTAGAAAAWATGETEGQPQKVYTEEQSSAAVTLQQAQPCVTWCRGPSPPWRRSRVHRLVDLQILVLSLCDSRLAHISPTLPSGGGGSHCTKGCRGEVFGPRITQDSQLRGRDSFSARGTSARKSVFPPCPTLDPHVSPL